MVTLVAAAMIQATVLTVINTHKTEKEVCIKCRPHFLCFQSAILSVFVQKVQGINFFEFTFDKLAGLVLVEGVNVVKDT